MRSIFYVLFIQESVITSSMSSPRSTATLSNMDSSTCCIPRSRWGSFYHSCYREHEEKKTDCLSTLSAFSLSLTTRVGERERVVERMRKIYLERRRGNITPYSFYICRIMSPWFKCYDTPLGRWERWDCRLCISGPTMLMSFILLFIFISIFWKK